MKWWASSAFPVRIFSWIFTEQPDVHRTILKTTFLRRLYKLILKYRPNKSAILFIRLNFWPRYSAKKCCEDTKVLNFCWEINIYLLQFWNIKNILGPIFLYNLKGDTLINDQIGNGYRWGIIFRWRYRPVILFVIEGKLHLTMIWFVVEYS